MTWNTRTLFDLVSERSEQNRESFLMEAKVNGCPASILDEVRALIANSTSRLDGFTTTDQLASVRTSAERIVVLGALQRVGPYRIERVLARGGFGVVYLAEQERPVRRHVALKVLDPGRATPWALRHFEFEREVLALLQHPNIASLIDAGQTSSGQTYIVVELVASKLSGTLASADSITTYCDRVRLSIRARIGLFLEVCHAVHHAHARGIIHRDLKPSNVLVADVDGKAVPKVIDFGIAKLANLPAATAAAETATTTAEGVPLGSLAYMSPEQATGEKSISVQTDVYSLGVLLYELLSGVLPVDLLTSSPVEVLSAIKEGNLPKVGERLSRWTRTSQGADGLNAAALCRGTDATGLRRQLAREIQWILGKAMHPKASNRYEGVAALVEDLRRYLNERPLLAGPDSAVYRVRKFVRRNSARVMVAAVVAIAMPAVGTAAWLGKESVRLRDEASARALGANRERLLAVMQNREGRGDWNGFLEASDSALAIGSKDDVWVRLRRVAALSSLNRKSEALTEVNMVLASPDLGAHRAEALLWSGDLQLIGMSVTDDPSKAAGQIRAAIELARADGAQVMSQSDLLYAEGLIANDLRTAQAKFYAAFELTKRHDRTLHMYLVTSAMCCDYLKVIETSGILSAMRPDDNEYLSWLAFAHAGLGEVEAVRGVFEKMTFAKVDPAVIEATHQLVQATESMRNVSFDVLQPSGKSILDMFGALNRTASGMNRILSNSKDSSRSLPFAGNSRRGLTALLQAVLTTKGQVNEELVSSFAGAAGPMGESITHLLRAGLELDKKIPDYDALDSWLDRADGTLSPFNLSLNIRTVRFLSNVGRWQTAQNEPNRAKLRHGIQGVIEAGKPDELTWPVYAKTAAKIGAQDLSRRVYSGLIEKFPKNHAHKLDLAEREIEWENPVRAMVLCDEVPSTRTTRERVASIRSRAAESIASLAQRFKPESESP